MTVNIAFKAPDSIVFATDGLATLMNVDEAGTETFLSNMENIEKLVVLSADGGSRAPLLAMFNGVGSLGNGAVASDLRALDREHPREGNEAVADYLARVARELERVARARLGTLPRPFHLIVAGFDASDGGSWRPSLQALQWPIEGTAPELRSVLEVQGSDGTAIHQYGAHYAGLTEAVARFVEGYDPSLPERLGTLLAGMSEAAPPGFLEQLAQDACRAGKAPPLPSAGARDLVRRYTRLIVETMFEPARTPELSQHFSLQSAVDYCVFLAQCAYARETLSPTRRGPPRVGSTLQVACLTPGQAPVKLAGIHLGLRLHGYVSSNGNGA